MEIDTPAEVTNGMELHTSAEPQEYPASSSADQGQDDIQADTRTCTDTTSVFRDIFSNDTLNSIEKSDYIFKKYQNQTGSGFEWLSSFVISEDKRRQQQIPVIPKYGCSIRVCTTAVRTGRTGHKTKTAISSMWLQCVFGNDRKKKQLVITETHLHHNQEVGVASALLWPQRRTRSETRDSTRERERESVESSEAKCSLFH